MPCGNRLRVLPTTNLCLNWVEQIISCYTICSFFSLKHSEWRGAAEAQWICLRLPSFRPEFESHAHHLHFYQFRFDLYLVEKTKIIWKEAGIGSFYNTEWMWPVLISPSFVQILSKKCFLFVLKTNLWCVFVYFWKILNHCYGLIFDLQRRSILRFF